MFRYLSCPFHICFVSSAAQSFSLTLHCRPPPWRTQKVVEDWADFVHPSAVHLFPAIQVESGYQKERHGKGIRPVNNNPKKRTLTYCSCSNLHSFDVLSFCYSTPFWPPPCAVQKPAFPTAERRQSVIEQRFPPPCPAQNIWGESRKHMHTCMQIKLRRSWGLYVGVIPKASNIIPHILPCRARLGGSLLPYSAARRRGRCNSSWRPVHVTICPHI